MATTIHEPPKIESRDPRESGNGGWRNLVPADGDRRVIQDYSPPPTSTGIWVIVYAITMTFAALTSAMIVRKGASLDWRSFTLPSILYLDTALLLASSVTLEVAQRRVARFMGGIVIRGESPARWLYITLGLGLLFMTGQYVAWAQLRGEGSISRRIPAVLSSTC
jgi:cytochrome c oxidase subunit III